MQGNDETTDSLDALLEENRNLRQQWADFQQTIADLQTTLSHYCEVMDLIPDTFYSVRSLANGSLELEWGLNGRAWPSSSTAKAISLQDWQQIIFPDDVPLVLQHFERLLSGSASEVEYRVVPEDGDIRWIYDRTRPVWDEAENRVVRLYGVARDITERKQAETALQASHERLHTILNHVPAAVVTVDPTGHVTFANQQATTWLGYPPELFYQMTTSDLTHPDDRVRSQDYVQQVVCGEIDSYRLEKRYLHQDGHVVWGDAALTGIRTEQGELESLVGIVVDITERKRMEEELHMFKAIVDSSTEAIAISDPAGQILYINPAHHKLFGRSLEEAQVCNYRDYYPPESVVVLNQEAVPALERGDSWEGELDVFDAQGRRFPLWERADTIRNADGSLRYAFGLMHDVAERKKMETALRESEARLRLVLDATNDGMWDCHIPSGNAYYSPSWQTMLGYAPGELAANIHTWQALLHPDDKDHVEQCAQDYIDGKISSYETEFRLCRKDGGWQWILARGKIVEWDDLGHPVRMIGTHADITRLKETETQLRESEARQRTLLSALPDMVFRIDQDGVFVDFKTPRDEQLLLPPEQFLGKPYREVMPPFLSEQLDHAMVCARQSGEIERFEYRLPLLDGQIEDYEARVVVGAGNHIFCIVRNVSIYKQTEARIRQHAARAEALARIATRLNAQLDVKTILQAVCMEAYQSLQVDMVIIFLYDAHRDAMVFADGVGIPAAFVSLVEPVPCTMIDTGVPVKVFPDVPREGVHFPNYQHMMAQNIQSMIRVLMQRDTEMVGVVLGFVAKTSRSFTRDEQLLIRGIADQAAQAITNARLFDEVQQERALLSRRVAERTADLSRSNADLARAVRTKDEFLANMSHELRTPLNVILGMSEALQEQVYGPVNARQQKSLATIERSGRHLLSLINDILDLSKIEAGRIDLEVGMVSVEGVCQSSLQFIKQQAMKKQISVLLRIGSVLAPAWHSEQHIANHITMPRLKVQADERRLKQILINLLTNAVKFTPEGGEVGLDVDIDQDHHVVHFTVWDTGIGIAPEDQRRLFQPFIQVDSSLSREHEGTGLGLALVMRLTELHGGSVALESEVGIGSRFTISLPQVETEVVHAQCHDKRDHPTQSITRLQNIQRVLIIEDSPGSIEQMTRYLSEMGARSICSTDGRDALVVARERIPDLIVLDILLTDISGWDVLRALKADPTTCDIPVLIVSVVDEKTQGKALGAAGYLVKPITRQHVWDALVTIFPVIGRDGMGISVSALRKTGSAESALPLILLAEDNETNIITISDFLQTKGYHVVIARNGLEAVAYASERRPALILMDIQMPRMDGMEAIRRIHTDADLLHIPIIALTALAMKGDRERCLEAGANEYMSKPVRLRELAQIIARFLGEPTGQA